ncbi:MAG: FAD-dependent oxidoreductase [Evtepia sp.]
MRTYETDYDFGAMHARKDQVVETLRQGVEKLMKSNKITVVRGQGCIEAPGVVTCDGETYEVNDIIIATGSVFYPPSPASTCPACITARTFWKAAGMILIPRHHWRRRGRRGVRGPVPLPGLRRDRAGGSRSHPALYGQGDRPAPDHDPEEAGPGY